MAVTRSDITTEFPEFASAPAALIDSRLAMAIARTPPGVWDGFDLTDQGVKWLCAHLLACSPFARDMRLVGKDGGTIYLAERAKLNRIVAAGHRTIETADTVDEPGYDLRIYV